MTAPVEHFGYNAPPLSAMVEHIETHAEAFRNHAGTESVESYFRDYPEEDQLGRKRYDHLYQSLCIDLDIEPLWEWVPETEDWRDRT